MMRNEERHLRESDEMSTDERAVADVLGSLGQVSTPADFNTRVRSAIARGERPKANSNWLPWPVLAGVPLVLAIAIGGYFALVGTNQTGSPNIAATGNVNTASPAIDPTPQQSEVAASGSDRMGQDNTATRPVVTRETANASTPRTTETKPKTGSERPGGGSYIEAVKPGKRILPRGIDPDAPRPPKPSDFDQNVRIPVTEVLTMIGVKANYSGTDWKVESVTEFSTAGKAGLRSGDVIEAINDQSLTQNTAFKGNFTGKSIRVRRNGQPVVIDLVRK
jgi:membrane-associated protease RseP (regulator of RpoE activity)